VTYSGSPQDLPGFVGDLAERLRALEARFLIQGPQGPIGPPGPGSFFNPSWQEIDSFKVTAGISPVASITFPTLPPTMHHLVLFFKARTDAAVGVQAIQIQMNDDTTGNYYYQAMQGNNAGLSAFSGIGSTSVRAGLAPGANATAGLFGAGRIDFPNYSDAAYKFVLATSGAPTSLLAAGQFIETSVGYWVSGAAMKKVQIAPVAGGFVTNTSFWLYGIT
jgi:hypothetical protein